MKKETSSNKVIVYIILAIFLIISLFYGIDRMMQSAKEVNQVSIIVTTSIYLLAVFSLVLTGIYWKQKKGKIFFLTSLLLLSTTSAIQLLERFDILILPTQEAVIDFTNKSLTEVIAWGSSHHITIEQEYEKNDEVPAYYIINQDQKEGTLLKEIDKITVTVSNGPDLEKEVLFPNMIGKEVDEVVQFIDENYFSNVTIDFIKSSTPRDIVMEQDKSGSLSRNEEIHITVSLGEDPLESTTMENLIGQNLFHATLFLKRNGISYKIEYAYSDTVSKGEVMKQSIEENNTVDPNKDTVILTISKGSEIKVPNLMNMTLEEITSWVMEHNLKIEFTDTYDESVPLGKPISVSHKENETIEEGTTIKVTISKGPLKMESFKTVQEYRSWAEKYNVKFQEEVTFSESVPAGEIIKMSHQVGDIIKNDDTITITVSQGKELVIPKLVGKTKSEAETLCKNASIKCSFVYGSYSETVQKDVVTKQSRSEGSKVTSGATVTLTLSRGIIEKVNVPSFKGETKASAQKKCDDLGITCKFETESAYSSTKEGLVTRQSATGTMNKGSNITVYLSRGEAKSYTVNIQATWFGNTYQETVNTLKEKLEKACPGVTFKFQAKDVNEGAGLISSDSSVKAGNNTFVQGKTYTITINR